MNMRMYVCTYVCTHVSIYVFILKQCSGTHMYICTHTHTQNKYTSAMHFEMGYNSYISSKIISTTTTANGYWVEEGQIKNRNIF